MKSKEKMVQLSSSSTDSSGDEEDEQVITPSGEKMVQLSSSSTDSSGEEEDEQVITPSAATTTPKPANVDSSSSDEEEEGSDSDSDDDDDEPPPPHQQQIQPLHPHLSHSTPVASTPTTPKPANFDPASSDEEEEGSDSDSDEDDEPPPPHQQQRQLQPLPRHSPVASTPKPDPASSDEEEYGSDSDSDEDDDPPPPPQQQLQPPPPLINPIATPSIENKPEDEHKNTEVKKRFQRIWNGEDEMAILQGLMAYRCNTGYLPAPSDISHFHASIKDNIHIKATDKQLSKKIRALKNKFTSASSRFQGSSGYDLCKEVWGVNIDTSRDNVKTRKREKALKNCDALPPASKKLKYEKEIAPAADDVINGERPKYPVLRETLLRLGSEYAEGFVIASREIELLDNVEAAAIEERCKKLKVLKMEHCKKEMNAMNEMLKLFC